MVCTFVTEDSTLVASHPEISSQGGVLTECWPNAGLGGSDDQVMAIQLCNTTFRCRVVV